MTASQSIPEETTRMSGETYHEPVLLEAVLRLLRPGHGKLMLDGTLGGGGHSEALLKAGANVIGLDQDPEAIAASATRLARYGERFVPVRTNFAEAGLALDEMGLRPLDGILLDIGVSSHQLDEPARGFSFRHDGPLDMRMNPDGPTTAADLVNTLDETALITLFRELGEEPSARRISRAIVEKRTERPFATTLELAGAIESVSPRRGRIHPATKVFQALRIAVNRELELLEEALTSLTPRLASGGRFAVITFHSLEDRVVKRFFKQHSTAWIDRPEWAEPRSNPDFHFHLVTRRPVTSTPAEQLHNPRSRSAKLRVAEKH